MHSLILRRATLLKTAVLAPAQVIEPPLRASKLCSWPPDSEVRGARDDQTVEGYGHGPLRMTPEPTRCHAEALSRVALDLVRVVPSLWAQAGLLAPNCCSRKGITKGSSPNNTTAASLQLTVSER